MQYSTHRGCIAACKAEWQSQERISPCRYRSQPQIFKIDNVSIVQGVMCR